MDRLQPGQPPLRLGDLARLSGYSTVTIAKYLDTGALAYVTLPPPVKLGRRPRRGERRIPVEAAAALLRSLQIIE